MLLAIIALCAATYHAVDFRHPYLIMFESALGAFSIYVYNRTRHQRISHRLMYTYVFVLNMLAATAVFSLAMPVEFCVWFALFPVLNYLLVGKHHGQLITLTTFIVLIAYNANIIYSQFRTSPAYSAQISLLLNVTGLYLVIWLMSHVYEVKRRFSEQSLEKLASRDALTGLYNRHALVHHYYRHCNSADKHPVAMLILDLDYFKKVNDEYGHHTGDRVLIEAAELFKRLLPQHHVYRIGGEEFCVPLLNTDLDQAVHVAEYLRGELDSYQFECTEEPINLTASIGVSECHMGCSLEDVLITADAELYRAKQNGRNQVKVCDMNNPSQLELVSNATSL